LMDLYMPNCSGVEATRQMKAEMLDTRVLMFTVSEAETDLVRALQAGARGYLLKSERPEQIVQAIHYVASGGILVSPAMANKLVDELKETGPVEGSGGIDTQFRPPTENEVATEGENTTTAEPAPMESPGGTGEPRQVRLGALLAASPNDLVRDVDLVLSPPLEPTVVLGLHQWITEVAKGDIRTIKASWGGETVISVEFRESIPLLRMLADVPHLVDVVEEPYAGAGVRPAEDGASPDEPVNTGPRPPPRQFRLALKAG
ncbi:MAG: response regulator, partial [Dehalococcoidia bacterium]